MTLPKHCGERLDFHQVSARYDSSWQQSTEDSVFAEARFRLEPIFDLSFTARIQSIS